MYPCSSEPTVEELLTDPVARLLMARDGLQPEQVRSYVGSAKRKLEAARIREQAATTLRERAANGAVA